MEQSCCVSHPAPQIPHPLWNLKINYHVQRTCHWFLSWDICIQSTASHLTSLIFSSILQSVPRSSKWSFPFRSDQSSVSIDCLCGLVVRVPGYRSRGTRFDSRHYQIFWEVVGLEWGPLSLVSITEELLEWKSSGSGSRKPRITAMGIRCADHATPSIHKSWH
jgi:hypothetical protein